MARTTLIKKPNPGKQFDQLPFQLAEQEKFAPLNRFCNIMNVTVWIFILKILKRQMRRKKTTRKKNNNTKMSKRTSECSEIMTIIKWMESNGDNELIPKCVLANLSFYYIPVSYDILDFKCRWKQLKDIKNSETQCERQSEEGNQEEGKMKVLVAGLMIRKVKI